MLSIHQDVPSTHSTPIESTMQTFVQQPSTPIPRVSQIPIATTLQMTAPTIT